MWLAWAGLQRLTGKGERPDRIKTQLIVFAGMLGVAALAWWAFGLWAKLDFDRPLMLLIAIAAIPVFVLGAWSLQQLGPARRWASVYLRIIVLLVIVAMLAGFRTVQTHDELTVVTLIDTSESVRKFFRPPPGANGQPQDFEQWLGAYLEKAGADKPSNDYWALQTFDGRPTVRLSPTLGTVGLPLSAEVARFDGSNGQRAIESGMAAKQQADSALRMVLVSDGNLDGEVLAAVQAAAAAGVRIDVLPLDYQVQGEVMVQAVRTNPVARKGQTVRVTVELRSAGRVGGTVMLRHNDAWVDLNGPAKGDGLPIDPDDWETRLDGGDDADAGLYAMTINIPRPISETGVNTFDAVILPDKSTDLANAITANDRGQAFTLVAGPGRVLVVDGDESDSGLILPRALADRGIDTDLVTASAMPSRIADMRDYDAILFHNVAAESIAPRVQSNLASYVHDLGGGFVMIGGPKSFGAGGWTNTDIDKYILPVECQIPLQKFLPSGALILVIDRSGSMSSSVGVGGLQQQNVAAEAAILALSSLYPQDLVGVVSFDSSHKWIVEPQFNKNPKAIAEKIRAIGSGGGTNIAAGVEAAYGALKDLDADDTAIKHMIVITDGQGSYPQNTDLAARLAKERITISTVGVGQGHNAQALSSLARAGKGTFYPVNDPKNLPQVFIKEARSIRKNLIKEKPFTPRLRSVASPIMQGITRVPQLQGFVLTGPKSGPGIFMPIVGDEGEPIFAHHQVGLGRAAAFTADATNRWAKEWLGPWGSGSSYADFWARTVRQIARPAASTQADMTTTIKGDTLTISLDAAGDTDFNSGIAGFGNNLDVYGSIEGPDGKIEQVRLQQVGPGIYEARTSAQRSGNYIVDLIMVGKDGEQRRVIGGTSKAPGGELRNFESNRALLNQIAEMTGGRVLDPNDPEAAKLYDRSEPIESTSSRPLLWQLMPLLLGILLLDVACRRIAWEGQEVIDWTKGRVSAVLGLMQPRQIESANTMAALKAKRQQTTDQLNQQPGTASPPRATTPADAETSKASGPRSKPKLAATRSKKFIANEEQLAAAQEDFSSAVGGAKPDTEANSASPVKPNENEQAQDQGPTTSRLLDAKRRAQDRMNDLDK